MKQQINLYLPEFRVSKDPVTPRLMAQLVGGLVALMVLVSLFNMTSQRSLGGELAELEAVLAEETSRTARLDEELARLSQNTALTTQLEVAEARLESSSQMLDFLSQTQLGNVVGFSDYFKDLSRASFEGISLAEFELNEGGRSVRLVGYALDSAMVPRFVDNINRGLSPLKNRRFSPSISRSSTADQMFQFELSTRRE